MKTDTAHEMNEDDYSWTDFSKITFPPQFAAECLGISTQTLKTMERECGLNIKRVARGSVQIRHYTLDDLFTMAAYRREKSHPRGSPELPLTVTTFVQKGGTGKTTTTCNLGIQLAMRGIRTLIIDNDPQADSTCMFGYDANLTAEELVEIGAPADLAVTGHIGNLLHLGYTPMALADVIKKPFGENGPHLVPAMDLMEDLDTFLRSANGADFRYSLFIEKARNGELPHCDLSKYDVILFDNPPTNTMITRNAVVAADVVICPIRMDRFSYRSIVKLADRLSDFERDFKRSIEIIVIPSMYTKNRPRLERNLAKLSQVFANRVTKTPLFYSEGHGKALDQGIPTSLWREGGDNSLGAIRDVMSEIINKLMKLSVENKA